MLHEEFGRDYYSFLVFFMGLVFVTIRGAICSFFTSLFPLLELGFMS